MDVYTFIYLFPPVGNITNILDLFWLSVAIEAEILDDPDCDSIGELVRWNEGNKMRKNRWISDGRDAKFRHIRCFSRLVNNRRAKHTHT